MPEVVLNLGDPDVEAANLFEAAKAGDFEAMRKLGELCGTGKSWKACAYMSDDFMQELADAGVDVPLYAGYEGGQVHPMQMTARLGENLFYALIAHPLQVPPEAFVKTIHAVQEALQRGEEMVASGSAPSGFQGNVELWQALELQSDVVDIWMELAAGRTSGTTASGTPWTYAGMGIKEGFYPDVFSYGAMTNQVLENIGWEAVGTGQTSSFTDEQGQPAGLKTYTKFQWPGPPFVPKPGDVPGFMEAVEAAEQPAAEGGMDLEEYVDENQDTAPPKPKPAIKPATAIAGLGLAAWIAKLVFFS